MYGWLKSIMTITASPGPPGSSDGAQSLYIVADPIFPIVANTLRLEQTVIFR